MSAGDDNIKPPADEVLTAIADYVCDHRIDDEEALTTARYCLLDALGCAMVALSEPECVKRLGPVVPGATLNNGARVPGTVHELDPVQAAFNIGTLIRWLDYNDTWLAAEWGHPSDNLGAILACGDYISRGNPIHALQTPPLPQAGEGWGEGIHNRAETLTMHNVLTAMIKAYEIQGVLALENSFNRVGIDHVILVKIASTAIATQLLGGNREHIINALSNAWTDGGTLRAYRHAPNTGWRKSWAAGDATARAVRHALMAINGEMGYPSALSTPRWGFQDVAFHGKPLRIAQPFDHYVMNHILFKVSYPVEFHAQTAVECAVALHNKTKGREDQIQRIVLRTQEAAVRIINKTGPLHNHADRDHSLQYAVAIGLLHGTLERHHYSDEIAADPRIDALRDKMEVVEDKNYSTDYLDPAKRSIANAVAVHFTDGNVEQAAVEYPVGHRRRRDEAWPLLIEKFENNLRNRYPEEQVQALCALLQDHERLSAMPVAEFMGHWS